MGVKEVELAKAVEKGDLGVNFTVKVSKKAGNTRC